MKIGEEIRTYMLKKNISAQNLSDKLGYSRANIYKLFLKDSINTELLHKISVALGHNFFKELSDKTEAEISKGRGAAGTQRG